MPRRPNILWILTTQWRAQALGSAGDPNAHTPHLDALAARAVNFTEAVTPHPFGPFARAAVLTGRPSPQNGVRDYFDPLPNAARTIAHRMSELGYATAWFGKWHLARRDPQAPLVGEAHAKMIVPAENRGGFAMWEGFESGFLLNDPWLYGSRLPQPQQFRGYQSDVVCARAAQWIADLPRETGWFCVVSLEPPHPPYDAPAAGVERRDPRAITLAANVPRGGEVELKARQELAGYYAHIAATDRAIGRLLAALGDGVAVVFTSVHGDMHGAHGLFRKGWPHEESVRVPLLVSAPVLAPGTDGSPRSLTELAAITEALGSSAPLPPPPMLTEISMPSVVALPHQCDRVWFGGRSPQSKLVLNADSSPWLYFDLREDPLEMRNLVHDASRAGEIAGCRETLLINRAARA